MIKIFVTKIIFACMTLFIITTTAHAVSTPARKASIETRAISTDIFELMVGGTWQHDKQSGYYRAIARAAGQSGQEYAEVWLQWIAVKDKIAKVTKNVLIKEITEKNYPSLSLAMNIEENGQMVLLVSHYDPETDDAVIREFRTDPIGGYQEIPSQTVTDQ